MNDVQQLEFGPTKRTICIEGRIDESRQIRYLGEATQMFDGTWRCLAEVQGCLCLVQITLTGEGGRPL